MPFPDYTTTECEEAIADIDEQIAKLRGKATSFAIGNKSFDFSKTMQQLEYERDTWMRRLRALQGGSHPLQGPKVHPV